MSLQSNIFYIVTDWWWISSIVYLWSCGALNHHIEVLRTLFEIINSVTGNDSETTCAAAITLIIVFGSFNTFRNMVKTSVLYMLFLHLLSFKSVLIDCVENWTVCVRNFSALTVNAQQQAIYMYQYAVANEGLFCRYCLS